MGMRKQTLTSVRAAGKPGHRTGAKVGTRPQVGAPVPQSSNVMKRPRIQPGAHTKSGHRRLVPSSAAKHSRGISAENIELVVISDSEPESDDDEN